MRSAITQLMNTDAIQWAIGGSYQTSELDVFDMAERERPGDLDRRRLPIAGRSAAGSQNRS